MTDRWFPAPAVVQLFDEVNTLFPRRDRSSDGIVGDTSHQARKSEHNPCWTCTGRNKGIVLAGDLDIDDNDPKRDLRAMLIQELVGDPRVWYVISNDVIRSRTFGWAPRDYTGSNGHFKHLHVSFLIDRAWDDSRFFGPTAPPRTTPLKLDIRRAQRQFIFAAQGRRVQESIDVRRMQRLINARAGSRLKLDGVVGEATLNGWGVVEKRFGGTGRPRVPDNSSVRAANRGMFQLIAA